ncbi:MAG: hypothetical protein ACKOEO_23325, partial [Planctomycetaceae bacterium]
EVLGGQGRREACEKHQACGGNRSGNLAKHGGNLRSRRIREDVATRILTCQSAAGYLFSDPSAGLVPDYGID